MAYTRDILSRMITKEVKAAQTTATREKNRHDAGKESTFFNWLDDWCEKHRATMIDALQEPARQWPLVASGCDLEALVDDWVAESREAFLDASGVPVDRLEESMQSVTADWPERRLNQTLDRIFTMGA